MARALVLARRGLYSTDPNPRVGCVIVNAGKVVGEGWHRRAGEPHAEIHALDEAGSRAGGATAYVSLEPCAHHGRTPPCAQRLAQAGVARVIAAMRDPNPAAAGGLAALTHAGVDVAVGLFTQAATDLNPGFVKRVCGNGPWVRVKVAATLDGRTATSAGESKWITGSAARADVQLWRARSSAIVTGIGTVLADDPRLNVRLPDVGRQPLRVVLDPRLRTPAQARLLREPGVMIVAAHGDDGSAAALSQRGAEVVSLPGADGRVAIDALLGELAARSVNEVLVEAGPTLAGAFLDAGVVDELIVYLAPRLLGDTGRGMFALPGLERLRDGVELLVTDVRALGEDLRITARPAPTGAAAR